MLDELDKAVLELAYREIRQSKTSRVTGSAMWDKMRAIVPDIAPVTIPARLKRLVSLGLLEKDESNSTNRTKLYAPTESGFQLL